MSLSQILIMNLKARNLIKKPIDSVSRIEQRTQGSNIISHQRVEWIKNTILWYFYCFLLCGSGVLSLWIKRLQESRLLQFLHIFWLSISSLCLGQNDSTISIWVGGICFGQFSYSHQALYTSVLSEEIPKRIGLDQLIHASKILLWSILEILDISNITSNLRK